MPIDRNQRDGAILILISVLGFSMFALFSRHLFAGGMKTLDVSILRYGLAMPLLWLFIAVRRSAPPNRQLARVKMMLIGTMLAFASISGFIGVNLLPAGVYVVLFYTFPAMTALVNLFRGERLSSAAWIAIGLTLLGVALTVPDLPSQLREANDIRGIGVAFFNAGVVVVYFLTSSQLLCGYNDSIRASAWATTGAAIMLLLLVPARGLSLPTEPSLWLFVLALTVISTVIPVLTMTAGIHKLGSTRAAVISTVEPIFVQIIAFFFLGESLTLLQNIGAALIIGGVLLLQLRPTREAAIADPLKT
jgi:drug/metabolite transporter (DMT)-like permease